MTNPPPIPEGRVRQHMRDGAFVWQLQCPQCGRWGDIDDDQLHGRVSADHTDVYRGETWCTFHETRDWFSSARRATSDVAPAISQPVTTRPGGTIVSKILKLTLGSGETHDVPLDATSTVTVKTRTWPEPSTPVDQEFSYTDVVAVEVADAPDAEAASAQPGDVTLDSPEAALEHAANLPVADAAAHVEQALGKFPGDEDLLAAQADLDTAIRGTGQPPADAGETSTPPAEEPAPATVETPATAETPAETVEPDPATLETPTAAIAHANTLPTLEEAEAHIDAALAKFPDDPDLVAVKDEITQIRAANEAKIAEQPTTPEAGQ